MPSYEEIMNQIKSLEGVEKLLARKELKELPAILWEDEKVEDIVQGRYNNHSGVLVATNKRLIFIDKTLLGKLYVEDFPYDKITSIQYKTGWVFGEITIYASGNKAEIKDVLKGHVKRFAEYVRARITAPKEHASLSAMQTQSINNVDFLSQLERLATLKEKGLISDEEFEAAKKRLLGL